MTQIHPVTLTLVDDLVLSERSATTGGHRCLDRIPGSALRGWAAARLYDALGEDAWAVFHSGAVRFGDARPTGPGGQPSWPVPLCWHADKGRPDRPPQVGGAWLAEHLFNLAEAPDPAELARVVAQPRGLRDGYVTADGRCVRPVHRERTMTAIDGDGVVADGQLFSYQSLARDQRFEGYIAIDRTVPRAVAERVLGAFDGTIRIGRSRASGYGRVRAQVGPARTPPATPALAGPTLRLWLLSDAWLRDASGQPTLCPEGELLGLPGARLDLARSFIRTRRVSAWNAHRALPEVERQLLQAGSVITLQRDGGYVADELQRLATHGIGFGRALGLGEVLVDPPLLRGLHPSFDAAQAPIRPAEPAAAPAAPAGSPLLAFLAARSRRSSHADAAAGFVADARRALLRRWSAIRRYQALAPETPMGPGPSQWGAVASAAMRCASVDALRIALLGAAEGNGAPRGAVPAGDGHWDAMKAHERGADGGARRLSLRDWIAETLDALSADTRFAGDDARLDAWQRLCADARRLALHTGQAALDDAQRASGRVAAKEQA
ncbi:hypothetical protein RBXJA2T_01895 [Rubrivivax benzoatilyticus JA2 = ATCC BAA-35]|nr:hypothetical protein RBXJA2T_01895 [Rubrivivax benzoatilyticus JA2 = ATCC BAA-35]